MLATLPWLHQKFLPVWLVLVATALWVGWRAGPAWRWAVGLVVPTMAGLYLTALYNFAVTGSVRPDALFLAWGPGGVTSARVGQGVLGLLLDARYGILPYVPILLLATGGLALGGARRFAVVMPAAAVYYLTVASADNWAGAVCNLGRYFMPVAPLAVALVGIAIDGALSCRRASSGPRDEGSAIAARADPSGPDSIGVPRDDTARRGALALLLILAAWTGLLAVALWQDPHAANDSARLLAKSTYADGNQYVPNLFIRRWSDAAPGLGARVVAWLAALGGIAWWLRRVAVPSRRGRRPPGVSPLRTLAVVAGIVLAASLVLERWPGKRTGPAFPEAMRIAATEVGDVTATTLAAPPVLFLSGAASVHEDEAVLGPGPVELLLRAPFTASSLKVTIGGQGGVLRAVGLAPLVLRPTGGRFDLPLVAYHEVRGRAGRRVAWSRTSLTLDGEAVLRLGEPPPETGAVGPSPAAPEGEMEPEGSPDR
jgi:hypothetical protein